MFRLRLLQKWGPIACISVLMMALPAAPQTGDPLEVLKQAVVSIWDGDHNKCKATGFLINDQGDILTNDHVLKALEGVQKVQVVLSDGSSREVERVERKPELDLAFLKILDASGLPAPVSLGNQKALQEGKSVVQVVGFPAAQCNQKADVLSGTLSARVPGKPIAHVDPDDPSKPPIPACAPEKEALKITADRDRGGALSHPGSSGSPILNDRGQVVGILCGGEEFEDERGFDLVAAFAVPVDLALEEFAALSQKVPPHAPEIVGVSVPSEAEEGQEIAVQMSFWDVNGDVDTIYFRANTPSNFPVPDPVPIPSEHVGERSGSFTIPLPVPEGIVVQPPQATLEVWLKDRGEGLRAAGEKSPQPGAPQEFQFTVIPALETVQQAIFDAKEFGVVTIPARARPYPVTSRLESLKINKCLTLKGEGQRETVLQQEDENKPVIYIESTTNCKVTLERLTVRGGSIGVFVTGNAILQLRDVKTSNNDYGAIIDDSANAEMINAVVSDNRYVGILAIGSTRLTLDGQSTVSNNNVGIQAKDTASVDLRSSEIRGNQLEGLALLDTAQARLNASAVILGNVGSGLAMEDYSR